MERNEIQAICRLCLSEDDNLIYAFEPNGIYGRTAADIVTELLRIQVSAEDIYPKYVCVKCMSKLRDFKAFKDRCESTKEFLDDAHAGTRGIGYYEGLTGGVLNCEGNELGPKEEDLDTPLEKDPLDLTEDGNPIKSEIEDVFISTEVTPNEAIETASVPCCPVKNEDEDPVMTPEADTNHVPSSSPVAALDSNEAISVESDLSPPCKVTEVYSMVPSEDEVELQEEEERDPLGDLSDVKPSVSQLNGAFTEVKEELCEEGSNYECSGEVETLPQMEGSDGVPQVKQGCSNGSVAEISTAFSRSSDKGLISDDRDYYRLHSTQPRLQYLRVKDEFSTLPAEPSSHDNMGGEKYPVKNDDSSGSSCIPSHANNPHVLSSLTTTFEREEHVGGCYIPSPLDTPNEVNFVQQNCSEGFSCAGSDAGERCKGSSNIRVLQPWIHERSEVGRKMGDNMESGGRLEMEQRMKCGPKNSLDEVYCNFMCNYCGISFPGKINLRKHMESHIGEMMSKSVVYLANESVGRKRLVDANEGFDGRSAMDVKTMGSSKEWICKVCKNKFADSRSLGMHERIHSGEALFKCAECEKTFSDKSALGEHLRGHNVKKPFLCTLCPKRYSSKSALQSHLRIHSGLEVNKCEFCNKQFSSVSNLKMHQMIHRGEKPFKCKQCDKRFTHSSTLNIHLMVHSEEGSFECEVCNKRFRRSSCLNIHKRIHTGETPYECGVCNKRFRESGNLTKHMRTHTKERPFECDVCNKRFRSSAHLKSHKGIHTGEAPYECALCDKRFRENSKLTKHMRTHTKEKPFECGICHKTFRQRSNLNVHLRVHTGVKPYECETCSKRFAFRENFKAHQVVHTGERKFQCEVCPKYYGKRSSLRRHSLTHSGEKPFECEWCNMRFSECGKLNRHLHTHK